MRRYIVDATSSRTRTAADGSIERGVGGVGQVYEVGRCRLNLSNPC